MHSRDGGTRSLSSSNERIVKAWFPSVIWLIVIAIESTNLGSSENTSRLLYPIFHLLGMGPALFGIFHHVLRKTGHFVGYFTLAVLLFRAWSGSFPRPGLRWWLQWAALALFCTIAVAALDEWHQSFLPSRTSLLSDVVLDSVAALAAQITLWLRARTPRPAALEIP